MSDELRQKAKNYEEAVKRLGKINTKTRVNYTHNVAERNFDEGVSNIEGNVENEIKHTEKHDAFKNINGMFKRIFGR
jgi:hypothetical protein